jgi:hypothetical protein
MRPLKLRLRYRHTSPPQGALVAPHAHATARRGQYGAAAMSVERVSSAAARASSRLEAG